MGKRRVLKPGDVIEHLRLIENLGYHLGCYDDLEIAKEIAETAREKGEKL